MIAFFALTTALGCANTRAPSSGDSQTGPAKSPAEVPTCSGKADRKSAEQRKLYRFDFVLASTEPGKPATSSAYSLNLEDNNSGEIRMGSNIALSSNARQDVGFLLRSTFEPVDDSVLLDTLLEMTSAEESNAIRKVTLRGNALVVAGKETLVASLEDPLTHKRYQLTVNAVKLR